MTTAKSKTIDGLITDLFSSEEGVVDAALKKIPKAGDARMIIPLLRAYKAWESERHIQGEIEKILKELKAEDSIPELIEALEDSEFDNERALIISIFWNAGLFPIDDVPVLVKHAIKGDYLVALEVLTVIENIESKLDDNMLADSVDSITDFLDQYQDAPQAELLFELKQVLTGYLDS